MNPGQSAKETMHRKKPSWLRRLQSPSGLACSSAGTCSPSLGIPFNRLLKKWNRAPVGAVYGAEKIAFTTCQMSNVCCAMFNVVVKTPDDLLTKPPNPQWETI